MLLFIPGLEAKVFNVRAQGGANGKEGGVCLLFLHMLTAFEDVCVRTGKATIYSVLFLQCGINYDSRKKHCGA